MDRFTREKKELSEQIQEVEGQLEWIRSERDEEIAKLKAEKKVLQDRLHDAETQLSQLKSRKRDELKVAHNHRYILPHTHRDTGVKSLLLCFAYALGEIQSVHTCHLYVTTCSFCFHLFPSVLAVDPHYAFWLCYFADEEYIIDQNHIFKSSLANSEKL